ncbi:MAG: CDP-2,3-bis-(O-geranylgeranyl)-sn-glycerol synthase [Candidatus Micrarchaeaceae archaeon]
MDFYSLFIYPVLYILPAYVANGAPVLFGGGRPLDNGRKLHGKRVFGDNKTVRGTASALVSGFIIGALEFPFLHYMVAISLLLSIGTVFGDLLGSFIKRRLDLKPGASLPVLDQYGFFLFALVFAFPLGHIPNVYGLTFLVVLTGVLHVLTNVLAHAMKLKKVPW